MWKNAVLALAPEDLRDYLRDVEHVSPQEAANFAEDVGAVRAENWTPSGDAGDALDRFFAWRNSTIDMRDDLKRQEREAATLPPGEEERQGE